MMRLVGKERLQCLRNAGGQLQIWAQAWVCEVQNSQWRSANDVLEQFPRATVHSDGSFAFPVGDLHYVVRVMIAFSEGVAIVMELKVV